MADDNNLVELRPAAAWSAADAARFASALGGFGPAQVVVAVGVTAPGSEAELAFATAEAGLRFLSDAGPTRDEIKNLLLGRPPVPERDHPLPGLFVVRFPDQWSHLRLTYQVIFAADPDLDAFFDLVKPLDDLVQSARNGRQFPLDPPDPVDLTAVLTGSPTGPVWRLEVWRQNAVPPDGVARDPMLRSVIPVAPLPSWGAIRWEAATE
jgi:hypothetical protein